MTMDFAIVRLLIALVAVASVAACEDVTVEGSSGFLSIGMTKAEALRVISDHSVSYVVPAVFEKISVRPNVESLKSLSNYDGIYITDHYRLAIELAFKDNRVHSVNFSPASPDDVRKLFSEGQTRESAEESILRLAKQSELVVFNTVPNNRHVDLRVLSDEDVVYLTSYDVWRFHEPVKHPSTYTVYFSDDRVVKIVHKWWFFELP